MLALTPRSGPSVGGGAPDPGLEVDPFRVPVGVGAPGEAVSRVTIFG